MLLLALTLFGLIGSEHFGTSLNFYSEAFGYGQLTIIMLPITLTYNDIVYYNILSPDLSRGIAYFFRRFREKTEDFSKNSQ